MSSNSKELKDETNLQTQTQTENTIKESNKSLEPDNINKIKTEINNDSKITLTKEPTTVENGNIPKPNENDKEKENNKRNEVKVKYEIIIGKENEIPFVKDNLNQFDNNNNNNNNSKVEIIENIHEIEDNNNNGGKNIKNLKKEVFQKAIVKGGKFNITKSKNNDIK